MTQVDDAIRHTLSKEDAELLDRLRADLPLPQQLLETLRGQFAFLNAFGWVLGGVLAAAVFYCGWRFFATDDVAQMIRWGTLAGVAITSLMGVKLWFWMELQKNSVIREVKRLEFQVARLAAR